MASIANNLPPHLNNHGEFDLIFVGGGPAACVAASRLSAADSSLRVLVLEAGPDTEGLESTTVPAKFLQNLAPHTETVKVHLTTATPEIANRAIPIPTGHCLGGGSAINWLMYTRGSASDYDAWRDTYKNPGWGTEELLPLFKKFESFQVAAGRPSHGYQGPLKVSHGKVPTPNVGMAFLDLVKEYDPTRPYTDDTNDLTTVNKWAKWAKWVDQDTGRRSDAASRFLKSDEAKANKNLVVSTGCRVSRVLFDGHRAVGVEYTMDPKILSSRMFTAETQVHTVKARRMVVLSAGTYGSAAILERSGIGSKKVLQACGIEQLVDLAGVGNDFQGKSIFGTTDDHILLTQVVIMDDQAETLDFVHSGKEDLIAEAMKEWTATGSGPLSINGIDVGIKIRPNEDDLKQMSPSFNKYWQENFANVPDKGLLWQGCSAGLVHDQVGLPPVKMSGFGGFLMYPLSRGSLHIKSKNPDDTYDFKCGWFEDMLDIEPLRWAYKNMREIARRHPFYRGELAPTHPEFPEGSKAAVRNPPDMPVPINNEKIQYTEDDDKAIDDYLRKAAGTGFHGLGTCAMKPRSEGGVVDSSLNVYGVEGLKVADLSICPGNVGSNTYSTALVIGEKNATIIAKELGIEIL